MQPIRVTIKWNWSDQYRETIEVIGVITEPNIANQLLALPHNEIFSIIEPITEEKIYLIKVSEGNDNDGVNYRVYVTEVEFDPSSGAPTPPHFE